MTYGDPWQQQQQGGGDFPRGRAPPPPPPPPTMQNPSASSATLNRYSHHPILPDDAHGDNFAEKRMRRLNQRRTVDYTSTVVRYMQIRMWQRDSRDRTVLQPTPAAAIDMLSTAAYSDNPSSSFAAKFVYTAFRKENRCSINRVLWTPTRRHLITGSQRGEFTLWNGQSFKVEMNFQAHDQAIRSMVWSHNDNWMVSGDDKGAIRYWENNMKNVKAFSAHKESVRDLSFCRTDLKFCSCSDDATIRIWDFARCQEERSLTGHGWDVKTVDWHPTKSLLVSGGKDKVVKLWDAKTGRELCSFHGHKNTVLCVKWNQNGNWLLTSSKDQIIKLYDIRAMKELESFSGHQKDVTALAWHPFHEEYFVSGSFDGSIFHWLVGDKRAMVAIPNAHNFSVWDVAWHPMGHLLCSGSNDHTTKFWCRNRPGDTGHDKFSMGQNQATEGKGPGWFASGISNNEGTIPGVGVPRSLWMPSIDVSSQRNQKQPVSGSMPVVAPPLPPGLHPLLANQQQGCQQNPEQMPQQQYQAFPQQMTPLPMPALNPQLQPPSHIPMLPYHHLSYPPLQMPALGMPSAPSSTPGMLPPVSSMPTSHPVPMPGQVGMQGSINQIGPSIPQGHFMGWNPMQGAPPGERSPFGFPNMHGPSNTGGGQMYQFGGAFIGAQPGQMPMMPGFNPYQSGDQFGLPPPQPPGPPNHGQTPQ